MPLYICNINDPPVSGSVLGTFKVTTYAASYKVRKGIKWTLLLTPDVFMIAGKDSSRAYIPYDKVVNFEVKERLPLIQTISESIRGNPNTVIEISFIDKDNQLCMVAFEIFSSVSRIKNQQDCDSFVHLMKIHGIFDKFKKPASVAPAPQFDIPAQIKQLAELRDFGILTDEEFQSKKTELLKKL